MATDAAAAAEHRASVLSIPEVQLIGTILDDTDVPPPPPNPSVIAMPTPKPFASSRFARSTSAPPQLSIVEQPTYVNGEAISPEDPRLSPAYYAYYYSQRPIDPRLPPPLVDYSTWGAGQQPPPQPPHHDPFSHMRLPQADKAGSGARVPPRVPSLGKSVRDNVWAIEKSFGSAVLPNDLPRSASPLLHTTWHAAGAAKPDYPKANAAQPDADLHLKFANFHVSQPHGRPYQAQPQAYDGVPFAPMPAADSSGGYYGGSTRGDSRHAMANGGGPPVYPNPYHQRAQQQHQPYWDNTNNPLYYAEYPAFPSTVGLHQRSASALPTPSNHRPIPYGKQRRQQSATDRASVVNGNGAAMQKAAIVHELKVNKHHHRVRLSDVIASGIVSVLATEQNGSRFIQLHLENATEEQLDEMFAQLQADTIRLSVDVFANYVVQKFFEFGRPRHRQGFAERILGSVLPLSLQMYGCRVIQKALEVVDPGMQAAFIAELKGNVERCVKDQNGNHVIQKCIEILPSQSTAFIIDAFIGNVYAFSTHAYGCRVMQRLLEHCTDEVRREQLLREVMDRVVDLIMDQFGNYVVQNILERGPAQYRSVIIAHVKGRVCEFSRHKFASNVVEKCFALGGEHDKEELVQEVCSCAGTSDNCPLVLMVKDPFGNYVIQKILAVVSPEQRDRLVGAICSKIPNLRKIAFGKHIIATVARLTGQAI